MAILQTLRRGAQHGSGIGQALRTQSGEVLQVETGSLYPGLHRMERQGWIASKWGHTEQNQRARGRSKWETMVAAIGNILFPTPEG